MDQLYTHQCRAWLCEMGFPDQIACIYQIQILVKKFFRLSLSVAKESWPRHGHHGDLTVWFLKVNNERWCNKITCTKIIRNMLYLFNG